LPSTKATPACSSSARIAVSLPARGGIPALDDLADLLKADTPTAR
jgi:hypothetical protein